MLANRGMMAAAGDVAVTGTFTFLTSDTGTAWSTNLDKALGDTYTSGLIVVACAGSENSTPATGDVKANSSSGNNFTLQTTNSTGAGGMVSIWTYDAAGGSIDSVWVKGTMFDTSGSRSHLVAIYRATGSISVLGSASSLVSNNTVVTEATGSVSGNNVYAVACTSNDSGNSTIVNFGAAGYTTNATTSGSEHGGLSESKNVGAVSSSPVSYRCTAEFSTSDTQVAVIAIDTEA